MVNFDEIEFLESEIVDDDPDAPVGTLVHISDDGKVEEVSPALTDTVENEPVAEEVTDEPVNEETSHVDEVSHTDDNNAEEAVRDVQDVESVQEPVDDTSDEQIEEVSEDVTEQVEDTQDVQDDTTVDVVSEQENVAPEVEEPLQEQPADEVQNGTAEDSVEQAVEEPTVEQVADQGQEPVNEQAEVNEAVQEEVQEEVKPVAPKKTRKKAVKKEEPVQETPKVTTASTGIDLKSGRNVNDALFDTSFEIEQPTKAKVVSTKKKQEKSEDLWAVAVVAKPTKAAAKEAKAEEPKQEVVPKKAATKKSAPKTSTKVENTDNSTEEKKVAKSTDKTANEAKTTKKATATAQANEEKVVKAKAPAKEEKAAKAAAPVKEDAPAKAEKAPKATAKVVDNDETVIVEGEGKTHGKYVIKKTDKGNFVFKLYSSNYRVVAIGAQAYTTLGAAKIGIQSIINNAEKAPIENQTLKNYETLKFPKWEIYLDKKGEYRLRLFATNGSLIATTNDGYTDISGAKNGIAAVGRASKGCAIVRNDNLW